MIRPDLVIFDCDGVLVDTEPVTDAVLAQSLNSYGLTLEPRAMHGGTIAGVAVEARKRGANLPDDWLPSIYEEVFDALRAGVPVIPGVIDLIDALEAAGIAIAVASNGPMAKMEISLGPSGLWERLVGGIYSGHDHAPKPAPDMLIHAMSVVGTVPARTVMIDDMPAGWRAAAAADVPCLAYVADGGPDRAAPGTTPITHMAQVTERLGLR